MKKSLQELELVTPVINLLDARKIVGGYCDVDAGEIPDVVIVGNPEIEPDIEPDIELDLYPKNDSHEDQDSAADDLRGSQEQDNNNNESPDRGDSNNGDNTPTVQVPNGDCVPGAIAAIIQFLNGGTASDALTQANNILEKVGATKGEGGEGTKISGEQMKEVMTEITGGTAEVNPPASQWEGLFDSGNVALGFMDGGLHAVVVTDYNPQNGFFEYFDATDDHYGWYTAPAGNFYIIVFGVK